MLGGLGQAIADFVAAFVFRSSSDYSGVMWGHHYLPELVYRTWAYYYLYLTVIIFGMVVIRSIPVARRECLNWRTLKWLGLIFFSETLWYLIFREHSHRHVHTIYHLSLSMSLAAALVFWEVTGCSRLVRSRVLVAGIGLFAISLASVGVRPYGNLQIKLDWNWRRRQINLLSSLLPADAVVVLDLGDMDPSPEFFLERTFVRRLEVVDPVGFQGRPGFLITQPKEGNPVYDKSLVKNRLIALTQEFALFDVRAAGGALNAIVAGGPKRENLNAWGMRLSGFIMHPAAPGLEDHAVLNIVLPADEANTLTFWVVQPGWVANATDGVALTFGVGQSNRADMSSFGVFLDPAKIQKKRDWAAVDVVVPRSDTASILRIEAGCGAGRNCDSDWVWVAPVGNRYR